MSKETQNLALHKQFTFGKMTNGLKKKKTLWALSVPPLLDGHCGWSRILCCISYLRSLEVETKHGIPLSLLRRCERERDLGPTVHLMVTGYQSCAPEPVLRSTFLSFGTGMVPGVQACPRRQYKFRTKASNLQRGIVELGHVPSWWESITEQ